MAKISVAAWKGDTVLKVSDAIGATYVYLSPQSVETLLMHLRDCLKNVDNLDDSLCLLDDSLRLREVTDEHQESKP